MGKKKTPVKKTDSVSAKISQKRKKLQEEKRKTFLGSDSSEEQNVEQSDSDPWGYSKGYPQISEERLNPGPKRGSREKRELLKKKSHSELKKKK